MENVAINLESMDDAGYVGEMKARLAAIESRLEIVPAIAAS